MDIQPKEENKSYIAFGEDAAAHYKRSNNLAIPSLESASPSYTLSNPIVMIYQSNCLWHQMSIFS